MAGTFAMTPLRYSRPKPAVMCS